MLRDTQDTFGSLSLSFHLNPIFIHSSNISFNLYFVQFFGMVF
jgi:hypothetical protein